MQSMMSMVDDRTLDVDLPETLILGKEYQIWVKALLTDDTGKAANEFFHRFVVMDDDMLIYEKEPNEHAHSKIGNNHLFHGRTFEPEVGLYYYRYRYYFPRGTRLYAGAQSMVTGKVANTFTHQLGAATAGMFTDNKNTQYIAGTALGLGTDLFLGGAALRHMTPKGITRYKTRKMLKKYRTEETGAIWGTKVKYLAKAERQSYLLKVKDGKLYDSANKLFDSSKNIYGSARDKAIFVMDEFGNIYAATEQYAGLFHHSSFFAGKPVAAAGEFTVENGIITFVRGKSGHYRPKKYFLNQFVKELRGKGINIAEEIIGGVY